MVTVRLRIRRSQELRLAEAPRQELVRAKQTAHMCTCRHMYRQDLARALTHAQAAHARHAHVHTRMHSHTACTHAWMHVHTPARTPARLHARTYAPTQVKSRMGTVMSGMMSESSGLAECHVHMMNALPKCLRAYAHKCRLVWN